MHSVTRSSGLSAPEWSVTAQAASDKPPCSATTGDQEPAVRGPPPAKGLRPVGPRPVAPPLGPYAPAVHRAAAADRWGHRGRRLLLPCWALLRCRRRLCLWTLLSPAGTPGTGDRRPPQQRARGPAGADSRRPAAGVSPVSTVTRAADCGRDHVKSTLPLVAHQWRAPVSELPNLCRFWLAQRANT